VRQWQVEPFWLTGYLPYCKTRPWNWNDHVGAGLAALPRTTYWGRLCCHCAPAAQQTIAPLWPDHHVAKKEASSRALRSRHLPRQIEPELPVLHSDQAKSKGQGVYRHHQHDVESCLPGSADLLLGLCWQVFPLACTHFLSFSLYDARTCARMSHGTHKWVMSHMNKSRHICMGHVTYEWVTSHMDQSCRMWMSHVTYEWVIAHMNESCHIWTN